MFKVGSSGPTRKDNKSNPKAIKTMAELGLSAYEANYGRNILSISPQTITSLIDNSKNNRIALGIHGEFFCEQISKLEISDEEAITYLVRNLIQIGEFNRISDSPIPMILHPAGKLTKRNLQKDAICRRIESACKITGISPELIYLETMGKVWQFGEFQDLLAISKRIGTRICVDLGHMYSYYMAKEHRLKNSLIRNIITDLESCSWKNECYFHISGVRYNHNGETFHGDISTHDSPFFFFNFLKELKKSTLGGRIIIECSKDTARDAVLINNFMKGEIQ